MEDVSLFYTLFKEKIDLMDIKVRGVSISALEIEQLTAVNETIGLTLVMLKIRQARSIDQLALNNDGKEQD